MKEINQKKLLEEIANIEASLDDLIERCINLRELLGDTEKRTTRSIPLSDDEMRLLKELASKERYFSHFSKKTKIERVVLINTMWRRTAHPETVKKIRKFLQNQSIENTAKNTPDLPLTK